MFSQIVQYPQCPDSTVCQHMYEKSFRPLHFYHWNFTFKITTRIFIAIVLCMQYYWISTYLTILTRAMLALISMLLSTMILLTVVASPLLIASLSLFFSPYVHITFFTYVSHDIFTILTSFTNSKHNNSIFTVPTLHVPVVQCI